MTLSELSIRRPVFAWMFMAALVIFGGISFMKMGISQLPDVDFPVVSINIRLEGAAPEIIETEIADLVEGAVMGIQGVRKVTSNSESSEATIVVEFELNRDIEQAMQDVQVKVAQIQQKLPRDVSPASITKANPEDQPIMYLSLQADKYPVKDLMTYVNDTIKDQFSMVAGVGDVTLGGFIAPNLRVWVSEKAMNKFSLSVSDIIAAIKNEHTELPAGQVEQGARQLFVRTMGEAESVSAFGNLTIIQRGGQPNYAPIPLKSVARVEEGLADTTRISRAMGVPGVGLAILKQRGSNAVAVAKGVRAKIIEIQKSLPSGMQLKINFDSTRFIEQAVSELNFTLVLSALLTALVCWLFLGSWTSTLNVLLSIPTSIIGTFIVLYFVGFTLNTFTLLGLSLSIGIVVDDAIMVLENIIRHQEKGEDRVTAAILGAKEITFAAFAATLAIVAIFLPVAFMSGVIGKFFFQFGVTITVAVLLSLVEALTLTPMRCSQFVEAGARKTRFGSLVEYILVTVTHFYAQTLRGALKFRWLVIIGALIFFSLSFSTLKLLNKEFIPVEDQSRFLIRLKTPVGSSIAYTNSKFKEVEKFLATRQEVERFIMQVGGGSPGDSNSGQLFVTLKDKKDRKVTQQQFMDICRRELKKIPDLKAVMVDPSARSFVASRGFPIEFTVQGPEWVDLAKYSKQIMVDMEKADYFTDLDTDYQIGQPELHIIPDRFKAAQRGVSMLVIDETVSTLVGGVIVGRYPKGGHRYDIRLKLDESPEDPAERVKKLFVRNNRGEMVPLSEIVTIEEKSAMVSISRNARERAITVSANLKAGRSQQDALQVVDKITRSILPPKYHIALSGSSQALSDSFKSLIFAMILGLIVSYMILASQFNSFVDPITVLIALPFSISGAFAALLMAHQSINIYSMIGLVLLMGIAKKNSILLVDFTNQVRFKSDAGLSIKDALLQACPVRLRPILMTSVATVAGATPSALAFGPGAESRVPMAIAIIGGVIVSTILTLYVVPCVYSLIAHKSGTRKIHFT